MATQAIYVKRGTSVTLVNTGGDKTLNLRNLGFGAGRLSAFIDRGAGAAPEWYEVRGYCSWVANPTAGETLNLCVVQSDGTHSDGGVAYHGTNDAALTLAQFNAMPKIVGSIVAHTADTNEKGGTFLVRITSRYFAIGAYNASAAKNLTDSDSVSAVVVTPIYPDIQAAA